MRRALRFTLGLVIAAASLPALAGDEAALPEQRDQMSSEATTGVEPGGGRGEQARVHETAAADARAADDAATQEWSRQQFLNLVWTSE